MFQIISVVIDSQQDPESGVVTYRGALNVPGQDYDPRFTVRGADSIGEVLLALALRYTHYVEGVGELDEETTA